MDSIQGVIKQVIADAYNVDVPIELDRPDPAFGDVSCNVALRLSKQVGQPPREVATKLVGGIRSHLQDAVVEVAGPGFINITLSDAAHIQSLQSVCEVEQSLAGQTIAAEYSDPNPFKVLHAGHLYTTLVGDAVSRLMEAAGADVKRLNFGGDVGRHVGITMWAIIRELGGEHPEKLAQIPDAEKLNWLSKHYVSGTRAFDEDEAAKTEITSMNKRVYQLHSDNDHSSPFAQIYWTCRQWSYDGFDTLYQRLDVKPFDKYYPESSVADLGLATVAQHTGDVYEQSDGAVVYRGEADGLFTQVFISSEGLPTYAAKDVGLIQHKAQDFAPDRSYILTDASQKDHLSVVMASVSKFAPELTASTTHVTHGQLKLAGGVKMSSRKGNFLSADDILDAVADATRQVHGNESPAVELGAVRYAFLKNRIGGDIVYDAAESVSLDGNSGPYLQYAHARAHQIIAKVTTTPEVPTDLDDAERTLVRQLNAYPSVFAESAQELAPHKICTFLFESSQAFNRFYETSRVVGDPREAARAYIVQQYAAVLQHGLGLLGITAPDHM